MEKYDFPSHNNYQVQKLLGKGISGSVYQVLNKDDCEMYAIKTISLKGLDDNDIKKIQNEATILSKLDSENIVKYYDSFIDNDSFNIVMEYCEELDFRYFFNYNNKERRKRYDYHGSKR